MLKNTYKLYIKENYTSENLLKYALKDYANIDKYEIVYNEYGKPYLKDIDIYFNISNSKNVSVCVISNREIGIDIQYKTYKESLKIKYLIKTFVFYFPSLSTKFNYFINIIIINLYITYISKCSYFIFLCFNIFEHIKNIFVEFYIRR